jgi:hypothetical protein
VLFRAATEWVALLADAQRQGHLEEELRRLECYPLLVCDEVGDIPFVQAANLMFMLVSRRYERASLIVTSNKRFSAWNEIFGDDATAAAMIDRLVHHAEILSLKGDSYRLKNQNLSGPTGHPSRRLPPFEVAPATTRSTSPAARLRAQPPQGGSILIGLDIHRCHRPLQLLQEYPHHTCRFTVPAHHARGAGRSVRIDAMR